MDCVTQWTRLLCSLALLAAMVCNSRAALASGQVVCNIPAGSGGPVVVSERLAGVPAVLRIPGSVTRPPILLWHGFGPPASEQALMDALPLDDVPAVKVYLGLPLFGARAPAGGAGELVRRQTEDFAALVFEPAVIGAAKELPAVVKALEERGCMRLHDRIGLFGFSAGGAAVLVALARGEVQVGSAVTLNASVGLTASVEALERATKQPYSWTAHSRQLAKDSDAAGHAREIARGNPPPALLIIHGADDPILTPRGADSLYHALLPYYRRNDEASRLQLVVVPGLAHDWTKAESADDLRRSVSSWFARFGCIRVPAARDCA